VVLTEPDGTERYRWAGYLPAVDFLAHLQLGLGKAAFSGGRFPEAKRSFDQVVSKYSETGAAAEALYWSVVSAYKDSHNRDLLRQGGVELRDKYPQSDWAKRASVWLT
jgi:TolA-binding protein